jgi:hypothetical protein
MAADLKYTPTAGLTAQLCGDAHLSNFGAFASPERQLLFDLNDFDETLPGPFEYDVKRFMIAARNNGFAKAEARAVTTASVTAYREAMASFAPMRTLDIWYAHLAEKDILAAARVQSKGKRSAKLLKGAKRSFEKARTRDSLQALSKLAEMVDGRYRIVSQPPIVIPLRELAATHGLAPADVDQMIHDQFRAYREPCRKTGVICWSGSRSSTLPTRSSESAASEPARGSSRSRGGTGRTHCFCKSRKPLLRCWRTTCRRAASGSPESASSTGSG